MKAIKQSKYNFKLSTHQRHTRNQHDQMHENDGTINTIKMEGQGYENNQAYNNCQKHERQQQQQSIMIIKTCM